VAVIAAVFAGIIIYLVRLDMRLGKLEKESHTTLTRGHNVLRQD
jgi:CcmD family protein